MTVEDIANALSEIRAIQETYSGTTLIVALFITALIVSFLTYIFFKINGVLPSRVTPQNP